MQAEKEKAVRELTGGIEFLFKKNKVDWLKGHAAFRDANSVEVAGKSYTADKFIIATGSSVTPLPGVEIDGEVVVSSTDALSLESVPKGWWSSAAAISGWKWERSITGSARR